MENRPRTPTPPSTPSPLSRCRCLIIHGARSIVGDRKGAADHARGVLAEAENPPDDARRTINDPKSIIDDRILVFNDAFGTIIDRLLIIDYKNWPLIVQKAQLMIRFGSMGML